MRMLKDLYIIQNINNNFEDALTKISNNNVRNNMIREKKISNFYHITII